MRNAFKLKNHDFTIYNDIPKELVDLRKKHMPAFHEPRKALKRMEDEVKYPATT